MSSRASKRRAQRIGHVVCAHLAFESGPSRIRDFIEANPGAEFNVWMEGSRFHIEMLPGQESSPWRKSAA
jgi:hypothetical protein